MRVAFVGGGPGGLYGALLLKKVRPDADIEIFERNARGATYGWGVVFSDRTLTSFREADYRTYVQITDRFVIWDSIDVRLKGRIVRAGGQVFSGIARKTLLAILVERCEELGVPVLFEHEADPASLTGYDVVVGADGIHSLVREGGDDNFRPRIHQGRARYIWFGTTCPFDSFTFSFRDNEHGLFQAHAYPFDGALSTFIVECDEKVWRAAGLHEATTEESITYCEKLFADDLRGHPLLSNQSKWISFPTLTCRSWQHGNVALLGDAAHTAHFSIGSGTKLAMEDAIALANALSTHESIPPALADYELERKPVVERFQEAARQSQAYFESTRRYYGLEPEQFVFHLLTRSGRIDYGNLRLRDAQLIEEVDRWFARRAGAHEELLVAPPPAFARFETRGITLDNRVVVAAAPSEDAVDGVPGAAHLGDLASALRSGAGLVLTDEVAVSADGRITPGDTGLWEEPQAQAWASALRVRGARAGVRLNHSGRRGATRPRWAGLDRPLEAGRAWTLLAPSALPFGDNARPLAMTDRDFNRVKEDFVVAAGLAARAGFDVLVLEMARGYLLGSFVSPLSNHRNHRNDPYGGSLENRARFPLEVFDAVRAEWPGPLAASVCATDWEGDGTSIDDAIAFVESLRGHGCDLVEVTAGQTTHRSVFRLDPYFLTLYSERIRNECRIPTLVGGQVTSIDRVNTIVGGARADLCLLRPRR